MNHYIPDESQYISFSTFTDIQQSNHSQKYLASTEQDIAPSYFLHSIRPDSHFQRINMQTQKNLVDDGPQTMFKYFPDQHIGHQHFQHHQSTANYKIPNSESAVEKIQLKVMLLSSHAVCLIIVFQQFKNRNIVQL